MCPDKQGSYFSFRLLSASLRLIAGLFLSGLEKAKRP
jgi:hypothetical protein